MRAEEMFTEYKKMKQELSVVSYQIRHFTGISEEDLIESMSLSHPDGDERVQTSNPSDKTAKVAMNYKAAADRHNDDWYNFLLKRYYSLNDKICFFEFAISQLDEKKRAIIEDLLEGELTWDNIAVQHNISRAMVGKYRKMAIQEINEKYDLQNQQELRYLLS